MPAAARAKAKWSVLFDRPQFQLNAIALYSLVEVSIEFTSEVIREMCLHIGRIVDKVGKR